MQLQRANTAGRFLRQRALRYLCYAGLMLASAGLSAAPAVIEVRAANAVATVLVEPAMPKVRTVALTRWVERAMHALAGYVGTFPVDKVYVAVPVGDGRGVGNGVTHATDPPSINVRVGHRVSQHEFDEDWVLVHEMAHLYVPSQPRRYRWFEEGFAVYVEAMARMQAGYKSEQATWADIDAGLHHGEPLPGEGTIDGTRRWGRVYWSGLAEMLKVDEQRKAHDGSGWIAIIRDWQRKGWDIRSSVAFDELWPGY